MARLSAFTYALPCTNRAKLYFPLGVREGLLIKVEQDGVYGLGEFAPLKGIHEPSLTDALNLAQCHKNLSLSQFFDRDVHDYESLSSFFAEFPYPLSSLLSMVFFHHVAQKNVVEDPLRAIKLMALIEAVGFNDALALAQQYIAQGFLSLKVKVGHLSLKDEINKVKAIAAIAGPQVMLRLDGNRSLSFADASALLKGLRRIKIEYFEEPLTDHARSKDLAKECGINIAFDESLRSLDDLATITSLGATHVVIKPSRFTSVYAVVCFVRRALQHDITPIFSHCFESEFSSSLYGLMVDELGLHDFAHGIVAEGFFKNGIASLPLRGLRGRLLLGQVHRVSRDDLWRSSLVRQVF